MKLSFVSEQGVSNEETTQKSVCCRVAGSEWALEMAKINLVSHYLIVGVTDEMEDFIAVLEAALPRFFAGSVEQFSSGETVLCHCVSFRAS